MTDQPVSDAFLEALHDDLAEAFQQRAWSEHGIGMKVYVLTEDYADCPSSVLGVFSSFDKAKEEAGREFEPAGEKEWIDTGHYDNLDWRTIHTLTLDVLAEWVDAPTAPPGDETA